MAHCECLLLSVSCQPCALLTPLSARIIRVIEKTCRTQKLLLALIVQNEASRPGKKRALWKVERENPLLVIDTSKFAGSVAHRLLRGEDYIINLTPTQIENFSSIYDIIAADGDGDEIPMDSFAAYVEQEAHAHGSTLTPDRFKSLIDKYGVDQDGDGRLSKDEFLDFLRGLIVAPIPATEVATLEKMYAAAIAESPDEPMDEARIKKLFHSLGFDLSHPGIHAVLGNVDANGGKNQSLSQ